MSVKFNTNGESHARSLIGAGNVDKGSDWSISADDENKMLGDDDWNAYSSWHLGADDAEPDDTKAHYKYPFGKDGKVFRSALIASRQRAGQQGADDVLKAAGDLIDLIDGDEEGEEKEARPFQYPARAELLAQPWALMPECLSSIVGIAVLSQAPKQAGPKPTSSSSRRGSIAVLPIVGVITQHADYCGGTSVDQLCCDFAALVNDDTIGAIVLAIDSPGGSVYGVPEMADMIFQARGIKPIVAVANSLAASAAYWLGCSASQFCVTPSGEVGSIGVWMAHMDVSKALDDMGVKTTLVSAGKYKTEGNQFEPLNDDARAFMQSRVDDYYGQFTKAVARGRGVPVEQVRSGMGEGRVLGAKDAKALGMVDDIDTVDGVLSRLAKTMRESAKAATTRQRISIERRRLELL